MTLLQQEKSSEKMTLEKQIEDAQKALDKKEKESLSLQVEMQQVHDCINSLKLWTHSFVSVMTLKQKIFLLFTF